MSTQASIADLYDQAEQAERVRASLVGEEPPRNVVEALIRVVRDLPAIGKGERMQGPTGGYAYRGIEAMTAAAQPLFGKHGVLVCPRVLESTVTPIEKGGKPWVHREMKVEYVLRGPGEPEDWVLIGPFVAEADDNSDKSANKCMTQAYKQMLLQVLCISDRKDDPDEANQGRDGPPVDEPVGFDLAEPTYKRAEQDGFTRDELDAVAADAVGRAVKLPEVLRTEWKQVRDAWQAFREERQKIAPPAQESSFSPEGEPAPTDSATSEASTGADTPQGAPAGGAALGSRAKKKADG